MPPEAGYAAILFALVRNQLLIVRYCDIPALLIRRGVFDERNFEDLI